MRFIAPPRESIDAGVFQRLPFADWSEDYADLLSGVDWPSIAHWERERLRAEARDRIQRPAFTAQTPELLADGLHYEQRIAAGLLATREQNWHDLLNALIWLRYPRIKHALNAGQMTGIAQVGTRQRTRAQCAMTHFDEGGAIVLVSDPHLLALWDAHDWHALFVKHRAAWGQQITVLVFGHAVLEHALRAESLLVAKSLVLLTDAHNVRTAVTSLVRADVDACIAGLIADSAVLIDPQELRPLPLCGIPGWHLRGDQEDFYRDAPCFRPLREGRRYPLPQRF